MWGALLSNRQFLLFLSACAQIALTSSRTSTRQTAIPQSWASGSRCQTAYISAWLTDHSIHPFRTTTCQTKLPITLVPSFVGSSRIHSAFVKDSTRQRTKTGSGVLHLKSSSSENLIACLADSNGAVSDVVMELASGASPNSSDEWGRTALQLAVKAGKTEHARKLLEAGADVGRSSTESDSTTPLHTAAQGGNKALVELLLEFGADVAKKDDFEYTAWHVAKEAGHKNLLDMLTPPPEVDEKSKKFFKGKAMALGGNKKFTQEEAEEILESRADWKAAEAGWEGSRESMVQMIEDPVTGETYLRRIPLRD